MEETEIDKELFRDFLDLVHKSQEGVTKHPEFSFDKNNFHLLSPQAQYLQKVSRYKSRIYDLLDDLDKVEVFLRRFPMKKFYEDNDIDHLNYTKYHTEVFYHKISTLLDLLKLMVNEVFEARLSERRCTWDNLNKITSIKDSAPIKIVGFFHKSFKDVIFARNLNTHRGIFSDSKRDDLSLPLMIYKNSEKFDMDLDERYKTLMPRFILDYQIREYKKNKLNFIKQGNMVARQYINIFMNFTLPIAVNTAKQKA